METNRSMFVTEREKWTAAIQSKEMKKEKDLAKLRKENDMALRAQINDRRAEEEERRR